MGKIPLRGQTVRNRTVWLSELTPSLDIKYDRNCCNVLHKHCRGMS